MADNTNTNNTNKNNVISTETGSAEKVGPVLTLSKAYNFEGEKIQEVDFSNHVNVTSKDMIKTDRILARSGNLPASGASENTMAYSLVFASFCSDLPVEFFEILAPADAIAVKNQIMNFFNGMG